MLKIMLSAVVTSLLWFSLASLDPAPAYAQTRVFVAAQGSDANPCTFALPCRTFQHAHDTVAAGGEIDVLDPAGYGVLTITHAVSIQGHGFAGLAAPSGYAITVNAGASDKVSLRGVLIEGVGSGHDGILFNTGDSLDVQDCVIRNFSFVGIHFTPTATSKLFVSNSHISGNLFGITIDVQNSGTASGVIDHAVVESSGNTGIGLSTGTVNFTVSDSIVSTSASRGIEVDFGHVLLRNVLVSNNGEGIVATGGNTIIRITRSTITGNPTGLRTLNGGQIISFGDNSLAGNTTDGAPSSTIPLQ